MSNGGKGDIQRPTQVDAKTFSDNWERIFAAKREYYASVRSDNYADSLRLEGLVGSGVTGSISGSNPEGSRSSLDSPATYDASWDRAFPPPSFVTSRSIERPSGYSPDSSGSTPSYINAETGE